MRTWTITALLVFATGCTAAKANLSIINADQALVRAQTEGADGVARYEYTMASRYLEKAREEAGYSEYRVADALARQSAEWSDRAIIFVERRGRTEINLDDFSDVPTQIDVQIVPPPPPPDDDDDGPPADPDKPSDADLFEPETPIEPMPDLDETEPELDEPEEEPVEDEFEMEDDIDLGGGPQ